MLVLGWLVGRGSTTLDDWFGPYRNGPARVLLFFTDPRVLAPVLLVTVALTLYRRRWRLAAAAIVAPPVAILAVELTKRGFDRRRGDSLAYPSGHTTVMVVVVGLAVLATGAAVWGVATAVIVGVLGMLGQAVTHHYFTDTIGGVLLGTAIIALAALVDGASREDGRI